MLPNYTYLNCEFHLITFSNRQSIGTFNWLEKQYDMHMNSFWWKTGHFCAGIGYTIFSTYSRDEYIVRSIVVRNLANINFFLWEFYRIKNRYIYILLFPTLHWEEIGHSFYRLIYSKGPNVKMIISISNQCFSIVGRFVGSLRVLLIYCFKNVLKKKK